jgi:hypothetical protein
MTSPWRHILIQAPNRPFTESLYEAEPFGAIYKIVNAVATSYGLKQHPHNLPWNKCLLNDNHTATTTDDVRAVLEWHGDHFQLMGQHPIVTTLMRKIEQKSRQLAKMMDSSIWWTDGNPP